MTDKERRVVEELTHAMESVAQVHRDMEEMRGYAALTKRADTIVGKLYDLIWAVVDKA